MTNAQGNTGRTQLIDVDAYRDTRCECWVSKAPGWVQFGLHFGAHSLKCPRYRVSLDPVDRANDEEQRRHGERDAAARALNNCPNCQRRVPVTDLTFSDNTITGCKTCWRESCERQS